MRTPALMDAAPNANAVHAPEALTWRAAAGGLRLPGRFGRGWLLLSLFFAAMLAATAVLPSLLRP